MVHPIVARGDVLNTIGGVCAFRITGSTGGVRVTGTYRRIFNIGITGMGAMDVENGFHHRNEGGNNCSGD